MTNEERAAQIAYANAGDSSAIAKALKAAGLLAPDPEPKYRVSENDNNAILKGEFIHFLVTYRATPDERACVLAALNALDET